MKKTLKLILSFVLCMTLINFEKVKAAEAYVTSSGGETEGTITVSWYGASWNISVSGDANDVIAGYTSSGENEWGSKTYYFSGHDTYSITISGDVTDGETMETVDIGDFASFTIKHSFSAATCTSPEKCSCGETKGSALGHNYKDGKCTRCGAADPNYKKPEEQKPNNPTVKPEDPTPANPTPANPTVKPGETEVKPGNTEVKPGETEKTEEEKKEEKSNDARLYSLYVSGGELKPAFDSEVYSYSVEVTHDTNEVTIEANKWNEKATVEGTGLKILKTGHNSFTIDVKAEDGTKKAYTIDILRQENPNVYVEFNGKKYGVLTEYPSNDIPKGFKKETIQIENKDVTVLQNKNGSLTLVYLTEENSDVADFYYYDVKEHKVLNKFLTIEIDNITYYIVDIPQKDSTISGMSLKEITINNKDINAYLFENNQDFDNYCVLYLLTSDGKTAYYLYDKDTDKVQKIPDEVNLDATGIIEWIDSQKEESPFGQYAIYGGIALAALVILALIIKLLKKGKKDDDEDEMFVTESMSVETTIVPEPSVIEEPISVEEEKFVESVFGEVATPVVSAQEIKEEISSVVIDDDEEDDWLDSDILNAVLKDEDE